MHCSDLGTNWLGSKGRRSIPKWMQSRKLLTFIQYCLLMLPIHFADLILTIFLIQLSLLLLSFLLLEFETRLTLELETPWFTLFCLIYRLNVCLTSVQTQSMELNHLILNSELKFRSFPYAHLTCQQLLSWVFHF